MTDLKPSEGRIDTQIPDLLKGSERRSAGQAAITKKSAAGREAAQGLGLHAVAGSSVFRRFGQEGQPYEPAYVLDLQSFTGMLGLPI